LRMIDAWPLAMLPPVIPYYCCNASMALLFLVLCAVAVLPCLDDALFDFNDGWELKFIRPPLEVGVWATDMLWPWCYR